MADENGVVYLELAEQSQVAGGELCSHIARAFIVWNLQQILTNSEDLRRSVGVTASDIETWLQSVLGYDSATLIHLRAFQERFDLQKLTVHPLDWPIWYVYEIARALIPETQALKNVLRDWDSDLERKLWLVRFWPEFASQFRDNSLRIAVVG